MKTVLDGYRRQNLPIIHIVRIYRRDGSNVDLCRKQALENGASLFLEGVRAVSWQGNCLIGMCSGCGITFVRWYSKDRH